MSPQVRNRGTVHTTACSLVYIGLSIRKIANFSSKQFLCRVATPLLSPHFACVALLRVCVDGASQIEFRQAGAAGTAGDSCAHPV